MTLHLQGSVTSWTQAVERLPDGFNIKAVNRPDLLRDARVVRPVGTTLRHWADDMQQFGGNWETQKARARQYFNRFIDGTFRSQYAAHVDIVETFNEVWAASQNAQERLERIHQDRAFAVVWNQEYRISPELAHIRVALMSAAVGNDLPRDSAVTALAEDCVLNYHPYIAVYWPGNQTEAAVAPEARAALRQSTQPYLVDIPEGLRLEMSATPGQRSAGDWRWCSGRFHFMEQEWGLKPRWILSEAGPVRDYTGGLILDPQGGWRLIWGASGRAQMADMMRQWLSDLVGTAAFQEGRIAGFHQFTTGGGNTWKWFESGQPELNMVADLTREMWTVHPPPPPEPHTWSKLVYLLPQDTTMWEYDAAQGVAYPTRSEITFSADSAFARPDNVTEHKVIVYVPERWGGAAALEMWVDAHYAYFPPTEIQYRGFVPAGFELAADVSQWQGVIEWEKMREMMQGEGLE